MSRRQRAVRFFALESDDVLDGARSRGVEGTRRPGDGGRGGSNGPPDDGALASVISMFRSTLCFAAAGGSGSPSAPAAPQGSVLSAPVAAIRAADQVLIAGRSVRCHGSPRRSGRGGDARLPRIGARPVWSSACSRAGSGLGDVLPVPRRDLGGAADAQAPARGGCRRIGRRPVRVRAISAVLVPAVAASAGETRRERRLPAAGGGRTDCG